MTERAERSKQPIREDIAGRYAGKRIVVTGASGYLASNLIQALRQIDCRITRVSRRSELPKENSCRAALDHICGNVADAALWLRLANDAEIIFHFAAQTSVPVAEQDPRGDWRVNVAPVQQLLAACQAIGRAPAVLLAGTVTQAGIADQLPVNEDLPDRPITVYDRHKCAAEQLLEEHAKQGHVGGTTLRLANVYGPGPQSSSGDRGVLNLMIRRALGGEPLTIYGKGDWLRDYVFVDDVVDAFLRAGSSMDQVSGKHFVIGSGHGHTFTEAMGLVADRVTRRTGKRVEVRHVDPPQPLHPIEQRPFVADSSHFMKAASWQAQVTLSDGIDRTIEALS